MNFKILLRNSRDRLYNNFRTTTSAIHGTGRLNRFRRRHRRRRRRRCRCRRRRRRHHCCSLCRCHYCRHPCFPSTFILHNIFVDASVPQSVVKIAIYATKRPDEKMR